MNSPCLRCTRVKDPKNCENKLCKDWQAWFIHRWESMREQVRKEMEQAAPVERGIPLGGERYAHPEVIREYLQYDPCDRCPCPKGLCQHPCPAKSAWLERVKEVQR